MGLNLLAGALFDQAIDGFGLSVDQHLGIRPARGDLTVQVDAMRAAISAMLATNRPDIVLVQGDTNSAYAAALATLADSQMIVVRPAVDDHPGADDPQETP